MAVEAIGATPPVQSSDLSGFMNDISEAVRYHENKFRESFVEGLRPDGHLMTMPDHIRDQFKKWDEQFTRPEDRKLLEELKQRITQLTTSNQDYIRERVTAGAEKVRLELAMKAVSKTQSGIQQLLSAQ